MAHGKMIAHTPHHNTTLSQIIEQGFSLFVWIQIILNNVKTRIIFIIIELFDFYWFSS